MDADLNGTTFDGVRLTTNNPSSPQGGARAVAFDVLPSGLFGGVQVIKSLTPDIDAEGLGGIVNLLPRTLPEGREFLLDASVGSGTESLRGSPVWDGEVTAGARFGDHNQFSIIASYAFHQDWRGLDDIENSGPSTVFTPSGAPIDNDLEYRWYKYHRTRRGEGATMTWDVDDSTSLFLRAFDAGYTEYAVQGSSRDRQSEQSASRPQPIAMQPARLFRRRTAHTPLTTRTGQGLHGFQRDD